MILRIFYPILITLIIVLVIKIFLSKTTINYRLSKALKPHDYRITIQPFINTKDAFKYSMFYGEVFINFEVLTEGLSKIELHEKSLNILEVMLWDATENQIQKIGKQFQKYNEITNKLSLKLARDLNRQTNYTLYIKYTGEIRKDLKGFFRFFLAKKSFQAITLLYPNNARLVLPCFDEPEFKAKFHMNIIRPKEYQSFFNTKLIRTMKISENYEIDTFAETPLMSTYLLAFMVCTYTTYGSTDLRMMVPPKMIDSSSFSYQTALTALEACEFHFKTPYKDLGNPVLQLTTANKYKYMGMESWGLIILRPTILYHITNYTDGWLQQQATVSTILHEIIHTWFGNSVTLKWWNNLWLNEGFSRYYEIVLGQQFYPSYELLQHFISDNMYTIFEIDAMVETQAMSPKEEDFKTVQAMNYVTNRISYDKGASVLRMFSSAMGQENFDSAVREYLKRNHLKNTRSEDVFKHLRKHWPKNQHVNLKLFFEDWTEQKGYPMLTISTISNNKYVLTQRRFLIHSGVLQKSLHSYTIPITYTTDNEMDFENLKPKFYFNRTTDELIFGGNLKHHKWLILNIQQTGYYRVFYDAVLLDRLHTAFAKKNHSGIPAIQRASIINDLFTYADIGLKSYEQVFDFIQYLSKETEYLPWKVALSGMQPVIKRLTPKQHNKFARNLSKLLEHAYQTLGFDGAENETISDVFNRNQIISWLCKYDHKDCNEQAQSKLTEHFVNGTEISLDFRETLYCAAMRFGSIEIYDYLKQRFLKEKLESERIKILKALSCTHHHIKTHYEFILSNEVPKNFKLIGLKAMYTQTRQNVDALFEIITEDVQKLAKALNSWPLTFNIINDISTYFNTKEQLANYRKFIIEEGHLFKSSVSTLCNSLKSIEDNMESTRKHLKNLFNEKDTNRSKSLKCNLKIIILLISFIKRFY